MLVIHSSQRCGLVAQGRVLATCLVDFVVAALLEVGAGQGAENSPNMPINRQRERFVGK
jgi:hypothetical protein